MRSAITCKCTRIHIASLRAMRNITARATHCEAIILLQSETGDRLQRSGREEILQTACHIADTKRDVQGLRDRRTALEASTGDGNGI